MRHLPKTSLLGQLQLIEVYDYYDQPCLFSCKNLSGQVFIAVWVDSTDFADIWFYVPVSTTRFKAIRSCQIDLGDVFRNPKKFLVFEISIPHKNFPAEEKAKNCTEFESDLF